jgi:hypothetical protein
VLVVVIAVDSVPVPVVLVVDMAAMDDDLVPAVRPVSMLVARVGQVGQRVLVIVARVLGMGMALVNVVDMTLALNAGMPAVRPVGVVVCTMYLMVSACHGSSLL